MGLCGSEEGAEAFDLCVEDPSKVIGALVDDALVRDDASAVDHPGDGAPGLADGVQLGLDLRGVGDIDGDVLCGGADGAQGGQRGLDLANGDLFSLKDIILHILV